MFVKILNQYPNYLYKEFRSNEKKNDKQSFTLMDITKSFNKFTNEIINSLNSRDYDTDTSNIVSKAYKEVSLYLSYVLLEIIRKPLSKEIMKKIDS